MAKGRYIMVRNLLKKAFRIVGGTRLSPLYVSITRACNARCLMCPRNTQVNASDSHMGQETFRKVVEIFERREWQNMMIHSMGEPLLHPRFGFYVETLKSRGISVSVSTNGFLLDRWMDTLLSVDRLRYSIEGWDSQSFRKFRGMDFDRVYSNVKAFYERTKGKRSYPIRINTCLYKSMTIDDVRRFAEVWGPWVDEVNLSIAFNPFYNHGNKANLVADDESYWPEWLRGEFFPLYEKQKPYCEYPFTTPVIQPDGSVSVCCNDYQGLLIMGNIHEEELNTIFHNVQYRALRKEFCWGNINRCRNCYVLFELDNDAKSFYQECKAVLQETLSKVKK